MCVCMCVGVYVCVCVCMCGCAQQELVPDSCCRIVPFSQTYKESFVCNFLGLAVGATLPHHVVESEYHVLLDILSPLRAAAGGKAAMALPELSGTCEVGAETLGSYKLMVYSGGGRTVEQKCKYSTLYLCPMIPSSLPTPSHLHHHSIPSPLSPHPISTVTPSHIPLLPSPPHSSSHPILLPFSPPFPPLTPPIPTLPYRPTVSQTPHQLVVW